MKNEEESGGEKKKFFFYSTIFIAFMKAESSTFIRHYHNSNCGEFGLSFFMFFWSDLKYFFIVL